MIWKLSDLPPPPAGKVGWPWTEGHDQTIHAGGRQPSISIVTPSYNQGQYIEETIRSILLQGYDNLQYMIIDGVSTDRTHDVINRYRRYIDHVVIEHDRGQADAINKGLKRATGDIFTWINSDDFLAKDALARIGRAWREQHVVAGSVHLFSDDSSYVLRNENLTTAKLATTQCVYTQPGVWLDRSNAMEIGYFDEKYHYCFDKKHLMMYLDRCKDVIYIEDVLVHFRLHDHSKTVSVPDRFIAEEYLILRELAGSLNDAANRQAVDRYLRTQQWYEEIARVMQGDDKTKLGSIADLMLRASRDPAVRLGRPLIGAARRILAR